MYKKNIMFTRLDREGWLLVPPEIRIDLGLTESNTLEIGLLSHQPGFWVEAPCVPRCSLCYEPARERALRRFKSGRVCNECWVKFAQLQKESE